MASIAGIINFFGESANKLGQNSVLYATDQDNQGTLVNWITWKLLFIDLVQMLKK